uniref:Uncharacterized protein n=1 Tax=Lepeophtheirus salmonis TaxID=72036 RepID=A0A0K2UJE2_LEPSM
MTHYWRSESNSIVFHCNVIGNQQNLGNFRNGVEYSRS